jgi:pimeloyl-ACP methyl ester carboxylesterase
MKIFTQFLGLLLTVVAGATATSGLDDSGGSNFTYPYPLHFYNFTSQELTLSMAYMDIPPLNRSIGTIVLLHGKNFCGATWNATIHVLANQGYRVIAPDQIGFCKSTKPIGYQFSLMQLALNTNGLLNSLNVTNATVVGHSMGGMISSRYALMFPSQTYKLILVDPLGLENWFALGVPYQAIDVSYKTELAASYTSIKTYQQTTYYGGTWQTSYDIWVYMLLDIYKGSEGTQFAYNMAQTTDMIFTQPIIYELPNLKMNSLLMVGDLDNTAIGKAWAPPAVQALLGHYEILGQEVSAEIPNCTLVEFPGLGHAPQVQDPDTFHAALLNWLLG